MCYLMGGESDDVPSKETKRRKPTKRIRIRYLGEEHCEKLERMKREYGF